MRNELLYAPPAEYAEQFFELVGKQTTRPATQLCQMSLELDKYYKNNSRMTPLVQQARELQGVWYDALRNRNEHDYSVYDSDLYFADLWACWATYSRNYLKCISRPNARCGNRTLVELLGQVERVLDLGAGLCLSTVALTQIFPKAKVTATNLRNTKQWPVCVEMQQFAEFELMQNEDDYQGAVDVIFASEYFEHFPKPIEHASWILNKFMPRVLICANTFNSESIGHFDRYEIHGKLYTGSMMNRIWGKFMKSKGFYQPFRYFNNRPQVWVKNED
jgi:hypothetical protein